jgi:16S rRNA (guanine(966)-N(2))-methyltransferase RsmD
MAMRVIAGLYRSRPLSAPRGLSTRPTYDRLRETLFNVLAPRIEGAVFADLYAGSGANGIEALSRGAGRVFFVENATAALAAVRANLASLGIREGFRIEARSVATALRLFAAQSQKLDVVFLDPPYESQKEYVATLELLGGECAAILASGAVVIAEHLRREPLADRYGSLERYRVLEQGDSALSFYSIPER